MMRKMKRNDKGFTLVELMIVVVIIGILIAIAIPIYNSIQTTAEERACQANMRSIRSQLEVYKADTDAGDGSYPIAASNAVATWTDFLAEYFEGATPVCPDGDLSYTYSSDGDTYTLGCPNGHTL
ncbi:MAG: prepilin-type N-terminal cleavage/methylation domain-containing protein [Clostridia bacterium]|nr:prepilin-type N-terminal cleavage/methylation domain-containing protein [Clostridia bacterium]